LKRAVELDPQLRDGMGPCSASLTTTLPINTTPTNVFREAFDLKDRASERERFYISSHYYDTFKNDADHGARLLEQWKADLSTG